MGTSTPSPTITTCTRSTTRESPRARWPHLGPQDMYHNLADFACPMIADALPTDWVYTNDGNSGTYRASLGYGESLDLVGKGTLGEPDLGPLYLRWVPFRTGGPPERRDRHRPHGGVEPGDDLRRARRAD